MPTLLQQQLYFCLDKTGLQWHHFFSVIWDNFHSLPFDDGFFTLCPLPKLLSLSWTSLFCLNRCSSCWCIPPRGFDIHLCVSSGRYLALPYAFQLMLCMVDLYQLYHHLLQPRASPGTAASLVKTSFSPGLQASPMQLYSTLCDFVQRFKLSGAIHTDLNLLSYQTAIKRLKNKNGR